VMVLLTDGLPNRVPPAEDGRAETTILRLAAAAKAAGIRLYTVGVGLDVDINAALMGQIASSPDMFYRATDAEDLAQIYGQIVTTIGCSGGWPRNEPLRRRGLRADNVRFLASEESGAASLR